MARATKAPTGFARCVTGFLTTYMVGERGLSRRTVCSYARTVAAFVRHVEGATGVGAERIGFGEFTAEAVLGFLDSLEACGCGPSTRNQRLAALKSLAGYAMRECPEFMLEGQRICALRTKRCPAREVDYLEQDALAALLAAPGASTPAARRETAVMCALYDTGARVQELIDLELRDLRLDPPCSATLTGEGNKTRTVPLMAKTASIVEAHLADRGVDPREQAFSHVRAFCPPGRSAYTRPGIAKMLSRNLERARESNPGVRFPQSVHPHALRASKAIHLLDAGVNIVAIRDLLGHASVSTTQVYLRVNTRQKLEAVERLSADIVPGTVPDWRLDADLMSFLRSLSKG